MALGVSRKHLFPKTMKRYILLIALCIFSLNVIHAEITWTLSDDGTTLTISGTDMPGYYSYFSPWYSQKEKIKKVVIEDGVTNISAYAFSGCSGLTSITIPNSVTSIGYAAFYHCSGLTSITIPNSVTSIGLYAFSGCSSLTSITIPDSVTSILGYAFTGCSSLTSVSIPNSVTIIRESTFEGCSSLTSITIPASVTSIGVGTFRRCSGLTSITIPNSVTSIGNGAFSGCKDLTSVTIPNSVEYMEGYVFAGCEALTSITLPNSITSIEGYAFVDCNNLTSVTIPNSVTSIGESAFYGCSSLTSITIPNSVRNIENQTFYHCSGLTSITMPNMLMGIGREAFSGCSGLTSVTIPTPVRSIGSRCFEYCSGLTSITIPDFVTWLEDSIFYGCSGLTSIIVEEGNSIYDSRNNCNAIIEKESNTLIYGCKNTIIPNSVANIRSGAFYDCSSLTSITIPNSVTSIGSRAFSGCTGLTSITIPEFVTWLEDSIFYGCSGLTSITIPNSVTSIGNNAFYNCSGLTSVTIPNSVTSIGYSAFYGCSGLTSVTIPNSVTSIGVGTFRRCSGLTSVTIPNSVTSIGDFAFEKCSSLTSVTIPNSVSSIGFSAFNGCSGLTSVTCEASNPPHCYYNDFYYFDKSIPVYVPANSIETYKKAENWKDFTNIQAIVTTVTLDFQGGQDGIEQVTTYYKEAMPTGDDVTAPTRIGYTFDGYYDSLDDNGTKYYNADMTSARNWDLDVAEITLYAKWIQNETPTIVLSDEDATIWIGKTKKLTATLAPTTASQTKFIWSSSDPQVATVSRYGTITAIGKGTCTISCEADDEYGTKAVCNVTVKQPIASIDFGYKNQNLTAGTTKALTPKIYPSNADVQKLSWKSKNTSIAKVSSEGVLTAVAPGTATIICTATDGFKKADTITVEVVPLKITDSKPTIAEGTYGAGGVYYTRTLTAGKYAAFCLPYTVNLSDYTDEFSKVYVPIGMTFLKPSGTLMVMFKKVSLTETVRAGKPFVALAAKSGAVAIANYYKTTLASLTEPAQTNLDVYNWNGSNVFLDFNPDVTVKVGGTYSKLTGLDNEKYYTVSTSGTMSKATSVSPYRPYIYKDDNNSNAKVTEIIFSFDEDEMATDIDELRMSNDELPVDESPIYNLSGQRINKANAQKGVYIKNGKKYAK